MSRPRAGLSLGVIVALAVAIWAAVASGDDDPSPSSITTSTSVVETSTSTVPTTTSTVPPTTATTVPASVPDTTIDPQVRLEEVRLIVQDLYYRWFDAIYRNDEQAVRDVVATERYLESFENAVATLELSRPPELENIVVRDLQILREDSQCLVVFSTLDLTSWRGEGAVTAGVNVLLPVDGEWRFGTSWVNKSDLWEADCLIEPDF